MSVRRRIREEVEALRASTSVAEVRVGLGYTAVMLEDSRTGVAFTVFQARHRGCALFQGIRPMAGGPANRLLKLIESLDTVEATVGLAAANAISNVRPASAVPGDVLDAVNLDPSDRVAMIGYFGPLVPSLRNRVAHLEIFEEDTSAASDLLPAEEACTRLPEAQVAIISSVTIVNNTVDALLDAARNCREVVLLGSSTPLLPAAFEDTPVTYLSGITIEDPPGILQAVSEGAGTRSFKPFVSKWNLALRRS